MDEFPIKVRVDLKDTHGFIVGAFVPDEEGVVYLNNETLFGEIDRDIQKALDL